MAQVKALFYIPLRDNDGRDLASEISELEDELFVQFDGWTSPGTVTGAYRMADGTLSSDVSNSYTVVLDESVLPELERILRDFKSKTLQESIYLEIQSSIAVRFI
jgi:hypothetical protein